MSADAVRLAIESDLFAAQESFDAHSFKLMNVLANRVMSNVLLGGRDHVYLLPAFILKTVALELDQFPRETAGIDAILESCSELMKILGQKGKDESNRRNLWDAYLRYRDRTRLLRGQPEERKAYKEANVHFTALATDYIFNNCLTDTETLYRIDGGILRSAVSELERTARAHGCTIEDLILHSLFSVFCRIFDYLSFQATDQFGHFDNAGLRKNAEPRLQTLLQFHKDIRTGQSHFVENGTEILNTFLMEWRILFLKYNEIRQPSGEARTPKIELPKEAKDQITESVKRILTEDLSRESPRPAGRKE